MANAPSSRNSGTASCKIFREVRVLDTLGQEEGCGVRLVQHVLQLVGLVAGLMVTSTAPTLPVARTGVTHSGHVLTPRRRGRPSLYSAMRAWRNLPRSL